jgi:hypothetical protein
MKSTAPHAGPLARILTRIRQLGEKLSSNTSRPHTRLTRRFPVQLPLKVKYGPAMSLEARGETRDLSVGGVFFVTPDVIPAGAEIELLLPVPPPLARAGKMWMFCTAQVVRAEQAAHGHTGVGAVIKGYKIVGQA